MLQNIIWLIAFGHTTDGIVKDAAFADSLVAKIKFVYLNFKSVFGAKYARLKR